MKRTLLGYKLDLKADRGDVNDHVYVAPAGYKPPSAMSLRQYCGPILDQGQEGSCTGHAGAYYREALENKFARANKKFVPLSRAFIYAMNRVEEGTPLTQDSGAEMRTIPKVLNKYGVCPESSMKYSDKSWKKKPSATAMRMATAYQITEYMRVTNPDDFLAVIANEQVGCLMGISWYSSYDTDAASTTGFLTPPTKGHATVEGGHALYVDEFDLTGKKFGVPVVGGPNSWGTGWGDSGRFYYPLSSVENTDMTNDNWMIVK